VRQYLLAGHIDELHIAVAPAVLGQGEALFSDINMRSLGYRIVEHVATERRLRRTFEVLSCAQRNVAASSDNRVPRRLRKEDADHDLHQIIGLLRSHNVTQATLSLLRGCAGDCRNGCFVRWARVAYAVVIVKAWKVGAEMQGLAQRIPGITLRH
jgi:hypothetical protein